MKNLRVKDKAAVLEDKDVLRELDNVEKLINNQGRALLRQSGTEPIIRIMIEASTDELCHAYAEQIADVITAKGHLS